MATDAIPRGRLPLALAAFAAALLALLLLRVECRPGQSVEPPRGTADRNRSDGRQHGPLRVPEPGSAGHGDDRRELHPVRRAGRRAELLQLRRRARSTRSTSTTTATAATTSPTSSASTPQTRNPNTFLYNTGPITRLTIRTGTCGSSTRSPAWTVAREHCSARTCASPPDNIGPRSTPNYGSLATAAVNTLPGGIKVFAGQRDDPFFVDLGSIFDLAGLRPFNPFHLLPLRGGRRDRRRRWLQRPLDCDPGADLAAHSLELEPDHRRLRQREQAAVRILSPEGRRGTSGPRFRCHASAIRWSTKS